MLTLFQTVAGMPRTGASLERLEPCEAKVSRTFSYGFQSYSSGARRASRGSPQPTVNNSAATKISRSGHTGSGRAAPGRSRSYGSSLTKASLSAPAGLVALVPKSERTKAHEAPCMRSTRDQTAVQASIVKTMKTWNELKHYAGLDWAKITMTWSLLIRRARSSRSLV